MSNSSYIVVFESSPYLLIFGGGPQGPVGPGGDGSSSGDVVGPTTATDNAVARFNGTTGELIQNSAVAISDAGAMTGVRSIQLTDGTNTVTLSVVVVNGQAELNIASA